MKNEWNTLEGFMADNLSEEFRPFAYFDKHMDCIRVKIRDCSVTERRLSKFFTILEPNPSGQGGPQFRESVGFTIKGIAHLFNELQLPMSGVVELTDILDRIVRMYPDFAVKRITEEFTPVLRRERLRVDFGEEKLAA